jgi:hypothetical protein
MGPEASEAPGSEWCDAMRGTVFWQRVGVDRPAGGVCADEKAVSLSRPSICLRDPIKCISGQSDEGGVRKFYSWCDGQMTCLPSAVVLRLAGRCFAGRTESLGAAIARRLSGLKPGGYPLCARGRLRRGNRLWCRGHTMSTLHSKTMSVGQEPRQD